MLRRCTDTHTDTDTDTDTHARAHAHTHTHTRTRTRTHAPTRPHAHAHSQYACYADAQTHTHTPHRHRHRHTHRDTDTDTHTVDHHIYQHFRRCTCTSSRSRNVSVLPRCTRRASPEGKCGRRRGGCPHRSSKRASMAHDAQPRPPCRNGSPGPLRQACDAPVVVLADDRVIRGPCLRRQGCGCSVSVVCVPNVM